MLQRRMIEEKAFGFNTASPSRHRSKAPHFTQAAPPMCVRAAHVKLHL